MDISRWLDKWHPDTTGRDCYHCGNVFESEYDSKLYCSDRCGKTYTHMERQMHIDHMKAIVNGGKDEWNNICVSCRECNLTKSSKDLTVWIQELADRYEHI